MNETVIFDDNDPFSAIKKSPVMSNNWKTWQHIDDNNEDTNENGIEHQKEDEKGDENNTQQITAAEKINNLAISVIDHDDSSSNIPILTNAKGNNYASTTADDADTSPSSSQFSY